MKPLIRGTVYAAIGMLIGGPGIAILVRLVGGPAWTLETVITVGYPFALVGWLAGVGAWDVWARGWFGLSLKTEPVHDWRRYFRFNVVVSWVRGPKAEANPWHARTLEWQVPSPPPLANFPGRPQVVGHPYGYGIPGAVHAVVPVAGAQK